MVPSQLRQFANSSPFRWAALVLLLACSSCQLLPFSGWLGSTAAEQSTSNKPTLPKIPAARNAVAVELFLIDRAADDELLGDVLWQDIDQSSVIPPIKRKQLEDLGFRIGRTGSVPPYTLQTLMGLADELGVSGDDQQAVTMRRIVVPSGAHSEIAASRPDVSKTIKRRNTEGKTDTFENARCLFQMRAERLQDGWARLELIPEIHHGSVTNRPRATHGGWTMRTSQQVERLFKHRFQLNMNLGEIVVVAQSSDDDESLAGHFFSYEDENGEPRQRLLVLRLAEMATMDPVYAD